MQSIFIRGNDNVSKDEPKLVFTRRGNRRFLSEMVMQEMGLSIVVLKDAKLSSETKRQPESEKQAIAASNK